MLLRIRSCSLLLVLISLAIGSAIASTSGLSMLKSKGEQVVIDANKLTISPEGETAVFEGNVRSKQGDTNLKANTMIIKYLSGDSDDGAGQLQAIHCKGNVSLDVPGKLASAEQGYFLLPEGKVFLVGNVVLKQKGATLTGKEFVYDTEQSTGKLNNTVSVQAQQLIAQGITGYHAAGQHAESSDSGKGGPSIVPPLSKPKFAVAAKKPVSMTKEPIPAAGTAQPKKPAVMREDILRALEERQQMMR